MGFDRVTKYRKMPVWDWTAIIFNFILGAVCASFAGIISVQVGFTALSAVIVSMFLLFSGWAFFLCIGTIQYWGERL